MKETGIILSGNHSKLILEGNKTMTRRVITKHNSIIGEGGDWTKLHWDGTEIYTEYAPSGFSPPKIEHKAPLPFIDGKPETGQYLHVPYDWTEDMTIYRVYPRYEVGDRLWVKETWASLNRYNHLKPSEIPRTATIYYLASIEYDPFGMGIIRPSRFMPRWTSRITLEVTEVRVERLNQISESDVTKEGVDNLVTFMLLWDRLNKKRGYEWKSNCWVWVITFKLCQ